MSEQLLQTPSTGLRHPSFKEGAEKRCSECATTGEVDTTDRTDLGKCIHLYDETQGNKNTSAFDRKLSSGARK